MNERLNEAVGLSPPYGQCGPFSPRAVPAEFPTPLSPAFILRKEEGPRRKQGAKSNLPARPPPETWQLWWH